MTSNMNTDKMEKEHAMEEVLNILEKQYPYVDFGTETALIDNGILDSVGIVSIIYELEDKFGITVGMEYIQPQYFQSAETIWNLVKELRE